MLNKIFEFFIIGILTPIFYAIYAITAVISVFLLGVPIGIAVYLIDLTVKQIFGVN